MYKFIPTVLLISAFAACDSGDDKSTDPSDTEGSNGTDTEATDTEVEVEECEGEVGLEEGMCAPDFTLLNQHGEAFTLSELRGKRVALVGTAEW